MNNKIKIFEQVLEKLKFRATIPDDVKEFILYNKPKSLISALNSFGEYSFLYLFVIKIYYSLGRTGIGISIAQTKLILAAAAFLLGASISAGAAVSYNYLISDIEINEIQKIKDTPEESALNNIQEPIPEPIGIENQKYMKQVKEKIQPAKNINQDISPAGKLEPGIETRLGMNLLEANNVDNKMASEATLSLYKKLLVSKGSDRIVYRAYDKSDKNVNRQLVGRMSKLGENYVIRITVVEGESGKRLLDRTVTYSKDEGFDSAIKKIADQINGEESVWKIK